MLEMMKWMDGKWSNFLSLEKTSLTGGESVMRHDDVGRAERNSIESFDSTNPTNQSKKGNEM